MVLQQGSLPLSYRSQFETCKNQKTQKFHFFLETVAAPNQYLAAFL